ncbi:MAG: DNA primase [Pseudomonadota bacterium]|nr:DNA primase [Pseudomonadota bacterium]
MIPNDFLQTLLARVDIVDVVDRHVPLKKAGANYAACCPFHNEKSPSFTVSPTKQFYHCFGCGAHGTAITFLMEHGGRSFPEAVEELARDIGLEVPREEASDRARGRQEVQARGLPEIMLEAARFFRSRLKESPRAIEYLKARGLTGAIAARYGIGYAPDAWQPLAQAFERYDDTALEEAGLVIAGEGGKRYDRFRDRVMFPIHDTRGQVIGFGGRVIGKGDPKYLNSPETPLFSKGRELYGLYQARTAIREASRVVVVEGYMDVVALAQHGVTYAVATLGTSTTPVHVQKLFRLTDHVVFCFDGDNAGRKAAWRALENALPVLADGKDASFLFLPEAMDPDDFIRQQGKASFEALIRQASPLSEFMLGELARQNVLASAEGRAGFVAAARPLLQQLTAPVMAAVMRRRVAELSGLPDSEMATLLGAKESPHERRRQEPARRGMALARRPQPSLVRSILQRLLLNPELARKVEMPRPEETSAEAAALNAVVDYCGSSTGPLTTPAVMQSLTGSPHEAVIAEALATAEDQGLTEEHAALELEAGVSKYWQLARRAGQAGPQQPGETLSPEEAERERQRIAMRLRTAGTS